MSLSKLIEGNKFVEDRYVESLGDTITFRALSVRELNEIKVEASKRLSALKGKLSTKVARQVLRGGDIEGVTNEELHDYLNYQAIEMLRRSIVDEKELTYEMIESLPIKIFTELYQLAQEVSDVEVAEEEVINFRENE